MCAIHSDDVKDNLRNWRQAASVLALGIRGLAGPEGSDLSFHAAELAAMADQLADGISYELELLEQVG